MKSQEKMKQTYDKIIIGAGIYMVCMPQNEA